jgi:monothiol glutaredoxin
MPLSASQRADLTQLVRSHPVVLFMKGNRNAPACGFSATVVGILDRLSAGYETVDILGDPQVREGMKEFSSWPTFPQLYVRGEFVGGCDIVKELQASGELKRVLGVTAEPAPAKPLTPPRITVTPAAVAAFQEALASGGSDVLRLQIDAEFANDLSIAPRAEGDLEVSHGGVVVHIDPESAARADGITIDFVQAPGGMAFKIENPHEPPRVKRLTAREVNAMLQDGRIQLFDVRPEAERALASIARARPLDAQGRRDLLAQKRDTPIALHCHHGVRSRAAAEALLREGFTQVYNLEGGIEAWSSDVDPSVPHY